ncbi:MAG TPA: hypothetical protein VI997_03585 [Candidatus Thermoplasmatota archaeon]|nr:hypothetical protein [Candidatus Thermoplasmatota archaeon]
MIALVGFSGTAFATTDSPDDPNGDTPYCDDDQQRNAFWSAVNSAPGILACEGEHWEGKDASDDGTTVAQAHGNGNGLEEKPSGVGDVGVRVQSGSDQFSAVQIGGVGAARVWTDGSSNAAVYLRDDSDQLGVTCIAFAAQECNALAEVVHQTPIRSGSGVKEESSDNCVQQGGATQSYEEGTCNRDNTAYTVSRE